MQNGSKRWAEKSRNELGFLTATAVAGAIVSSLVITGWWSQAFGNLIADTDITDQALHRLAPQECRATLATLLDQFRGDPKVLWVWAEESIPVADPAPTTATLDTTLSREAPRPYAFRPDAAEVPAEACSFERNSLHALSLGGVARSILSPMPPELWSVNVTP